MTHTTEQLEQMLADASGPPRTEQDGPDQPLYDTREFANSWLNENAITITAELIAARRKLEVAENLANEMRGLAYAYVNLCEMTGKNFHNQRGSKYTASMAASAAAWEAEQ